MKYLSKHRPRIAVTLVPLIFALRHAAGLAHLDVMQRLNAIIHEARLHALMRLRPFDPAWDGASNFEIK